MSRTAKEQRVIISVGYMFRYHDAVNKMKEVIAEHGRPLMNIDMACNCAYVGSTCSYIWNIHESGGQATHFCDLLHYFGGEVNHSYQPVMLPPIPGPHY